MSSTMPWWSSRRLGCRPARRVSALITGGLTDLDSSEDLAGTLALAEIRAGAVGGSGVLH
jgi:hypothetical protein